MMKCAGVSASSTPAMSAREVCWNMPRASTNTSATLMVPMSAVGNRSAACDSGSTISHGAVAYTSTGWNQRSCPSRKIRKYSGRNLPSRSRAVFAIA